MSMSGSLMLLSYFILSNLFPMGVAGYNLYLDVMHKAVSPAVAGGGGPAEG
jgi:hypothetical protein